MLSSLHLQERERLHYLYWNTLLEHSLHESAWMSKSNSYHTLNITSMNILDKKREDCEVSPVSWGPMDSVISVPSMLSSSSTTTLPLVRPLGWRRDENKLFFQSVKTIQENMHGLPREGGGWQCGHELVKYSHSCHWFLMEALKSLGKAEGWQWGL